MDNPTKTGLTLGGLGLITSFLLAWILGGDIAEWMRQAIFTLAFVSALVLLIFALRFIIMKLVEAESTR